jgi:hypothetical protein
MTKNELLKKIFKATKGEKYFDQYVEKDEKYLKKLHTVITNWK